MFYISVLVLRSWQKILDLEGQGSVAKSEKNILILNWNVFLGRTILILFYDLLSFISSGWKQLHLIKFFIPFLWLILSIFLQV